jgi:hypothetical protein
VCAALMFCVATDAQPATQPSDKPALKLLSVTKIWEKAPHNAFTDLIRYRDQFVCCFREAPKHDGGVPDSHLRLLTSRDGETWDDCGMLSDPRGDIRDAKLSIAPDGRLMVLTAIQLFDPAKGKHQSLTFFTADLKTWDGPHDVGEPNYWLWGIKWHKGVGYSIGYSSVDNYKAKLYATQDGLNYSVHCDITPPHPNESAIAFIGDTAWCLLRVFGPAYLGTAQPPYSEWKWTKLSESVGGPELIVLPDGQLLGGSRRILPGKVWKTSLLWINSETGRIDEALQLPSGGDSSYPGMVLHNGVLHVSYYSSHEGKASIYFARVGIETAKEAGHQ